MTCYSHKQYCVSCWCLRMTLLLSVLLSLNNHVKVQAADTCFCAPATYQLTFDFNLDCHDENVTNAAGVQETSCMSVKEESGESVVSAISFASVSSVEFTEYNQDFALIKQDAVKGTFFSGQTVTLPSYAARARPLRKVNPLLIPKTIRVVVNGVSPSNEIIQSVFTVTYTNTCDGHFVLDGFTPQIGITKMTKLTFNEQFCPRHMDTTQL